MPSKQTTAKQEQFPDDVLHDVDDEVRGSAPHFEVPENSEENHLRTVYAELQDRDLLMNRICDRIRRHSAQV